MNRSKPLPIKMPRRFVMPPPPRPEDRPVITIELEESATIDPKAWEELMAEVKKHGGARLGAGRRALDDVKPTTKYLIAMTAAQRKKIEANGGAPWVRKLIDEAEGLPLDPSTLNAAQSAFKKAMDANFSAIMQRDSAKNKAVRQRLDSVKLAIKPDPEGLKGRETEGKKAAQAVAKRLKKILPKKP